MCVRDDDVLTGILIVVATRLNIAARDAKVSTASVHRNKEMGNLTVWYFYLIFLYFLMETLLAEVEGCCFCLFSQRPLDNE